MAEGQGEPTALWGDNGQRGDSRPGWDGRGRARFHHATQNSGQRKTDLLLISGIFYWIFKLQVTSVNQNHGP